jgi:hypothetical protein
MFQPVVNNRHCRQFSVDEMEFVRDVYPVSTARAVADAIGRRNPKSIRSLAAELGVTKERKWTDTEKQILRRHYAHSDLDWLCRRLDRSRDAVLHMVRRLKIQKCKTWTADDDDALRRMLPTHDIFEVAYHLGVTIFAVLGRCRRIGISRVRIPKPHPWDARWSRAEAMVES